MAQESGEDAGLMSRTAMFGTARDTSDRTLTAAAANTHVYGAVGMESGTDVPGHFARSSDRVTIGADGFLSGSWDVGVMLVRSDTNQAAELDLLIKLFSSAGDLKGTFENSRTLDDPITNAISIFDTVVFPLTPVSSGDYIQCEVSFSSSEASRTLTYRVGTTQRPGVLTIHHFS